MHRNSTKQFQVRGIRVNRKPMFDQNSKALLNGVQLTFQKGFGFSQTPQLRNNAYCIDDNKIIYVLGKQIVLYDMLTQIQKVIDSVGQQEQITCFIYYKNIILDDNVIFAVQAMNKSYPTIIIHNFSKGTHNRYVLTHLEKQQKVIQISLINQSRHFCLISQLEKTYRFSIIQIQSNSLYASENIYFTPIGLLVPMHHSKNMLLYSQNQIYSIIFDQQIKLQPGNLKKFIPDKDQALIEVVCSLHTQLIVYGITNKGYLYIITINLTSGQINKIDQIYLGDYQTIDNLGNRIITNRVPSSICCNQYNILIGYQYIQQFTLVKISAINTKTSLPQQIKFSCPYLHKIVRMSFAYQTMAICIIVQVKQNDKYGLTIPIESQFLRQKGQQQIIKQNISNHSLPPGKIFPIIFNLLLHDTLVQTLKSPVQSILSSMLFVKPILDISVLPTKKLILILSAEKKIKAIKYEHIGSTSFQKILAWETVFNINDCPTSLDTHPLTFNVAVGFKQGLKIFNICSDGLKSSKIQFPLKNCQCVRYSKFGHILGVGTSNQIILISPYEHKITHTIQLGYGFITRQLKFIDRDMYIFGSFVNGNSMILTLQGNKVFEVWNKSIKTICSVYDYTFDIMVISYNQCITKFYRNNQMQQFAFMRTYPFNITKILICNQLGVVFMGTSMGKIRCYQWPFTDMIKFHKSFTQMQLHSSAITEIKVTHDLSVLISGSQDGSIFISKINTYCDGIIINDSQMLHTFRTASKNYMSLYYLQNYMCTNNNIDSQQEQIIVQLESDKADFETQHNQIINTIKQQTQKKVQKQQLARVTSMKDQMLPHQKTIQILNNKKIQTKQQLSILLKNKISIENQLNQSKIQKMRNLYQQNDKLKQKKQYYQKKYQNQKQTIIKIYQQKLIGQNKQYQKTINQLINNCNQLEIQCKQSIINYKQLLNQQIQQGQIYKQTMLAQMAQQLINAKQKGQQLRKTLNKNNHQISKYQQKLKYFQQLTSQIQINTDSAKIKNIKLKQHLQYLSKVLQQKDQQIFDQQKTVKQLLTNNINNYSHQQYLKHKQQQLLSKATFLQHQIQDLKNKCKSFQNNFIQATKQTNQFNQKRSKAINDINNLKNKSKKLKQIQYQLKYQQKQLFNLILQQFHNSNTKDQFKGKLNKILNMVQNYNINQNSVQSNIQQRDHIIKQVINTNKLRKIDDTIRKTIMVKLNRQTVSLTCQVNQLRKQKRNLTNKIKQLQLCISQLKQIQIDPKQMLSLRQIVPTNISIIKSPNSKSIQKLLPFQVYHQNKVSKTSMHYKPITKSEYDQNSTQLPSIVKNSQIQSNNTSRLEGVQQNDDQILQ